MMVVAVDYDGSDNGNYDFMVMMVVVFVVVLMVVMVVG